LQTRRVVDSFEQFSAIGRGAIQLIRQLKTACFRLISKYE